MPISEDEYSHQDSMPSTTMSRAELRKTHKPIMEKRRRAKINNCLNEIKDLILVAMKKDPERHSKLEKADILEMAVKHLKNIQRQQRDIALRSDPALANKYRTGFMECTTEVSGFINKMDGIDNGLKERLIMHLSNCASNNTEPTFAPSANHSFLASISRGGFGNKDDQNNNARIELIPSCLPSGEFAFLVPKASFSSILSDERTSAFVTVTPSTKSHGEGLLKIASPPVSPLRSSSPKGFQPFNKKEVIRSIKFPINNTMKSEPLSIITNSAERFRSAQMLKETQQNEENIFTGVKRKLLLTESTRKVVKLEPEQAASSSSSSYSRNEDKDDDDEDKEKPEQMWRPW